ncbi:ring finger protein 146 isoform X2 [Colletes latitarsis]|uniref:ring finger protein 146 isoform X2 n=1 Tax=Colletes latitarsis TaxID=2605962 RepID=UPI0040368224
MAQAKINSQDKTDNTLKDKEKEADEKEGSTIVPECAVCLQPCIYPARLPCNHVYCYLCVKGVANQSKRCPMCRQEIPPDFLDRPQLVDVDEALKESEHSEEEYQWFYEGRNGFLYIADFGSMLQLRRNDPSRRRRIKRDLYNVPKKGVAGLRLNNQDEEIIREIRGAERPASPASDNMGIGDETNTLVPPSNTPQTPAGGTASGDATPLNDRLEQRSDSLHQVLEQMRSLVQREHLSSNADNELEEIVENESLSTHPTL